MSCLLTLVINVEKTNNFFFGKHTQLSLLEILNGRPPN